VSRFRFLGFQCVDIRIFGVTVRSGMEGGALGRQLNPRKRKGTGIRPSLCLGLADILRVSFFYFSYNSVIRPEGERQEIQ
jgi:hypothetical protein